MERVEIDLNVRVHGHRTFSGFEDATGPVEPGQTVEVFEGESSLSGYAIVEEVDHDRRLIYLTVDWASLRPADESSIDSSEKTGQVPGAVRENIDQAHESRSLIGSVPRTPVRIFLSWSHRDARLKDALIRDLLPALSVLSDLDIEWWEDSHLIPGEEIAPAILDRLRDADFAILLLSTGYVGQPHIRAQALPHFVGIDAVRSLPVALGPLPDLGYDPDLGGIERLLVFTKDGRSFAELSGSRRVLFTNDLAGAIRRRILSEASHRPSNR